MSGNDDQDGLFVAGLSTCAAVFLLVVGTAGSFASALGASDNVACAIALCSLPLAMYSALKAVKYVWRDR